MADVERIRAEFSPGKRLVLVGGGYIGLEIAATARACGLDVVILEMADRVLNRVTCREISAIYAAEHARHGVRGRRGGREIEHLQEVAGGGNDDIANLPRALVHHVKTPPGNAAAETAPQHLTTSPSVPG
jgi:3-phenylpropionate/trans-cinnamate dioxygenase ferredoxin reductase subunit